ncbi:SRPBCC family protein [Spirillospora sp. CA-294931]|uniref:SRPBCC family protein n=1 Tax=Spirillospora sp. CA-294931 TaxID=3240042 RepID=UPI003D8BCA5A
MSQDRIEREIVIAAPVERVWSVITEPEHVGSWFGAAGKPAEIDLRPGGTMVVDHGEYGVFPSTIVEVDPPRTFSWRWASAFPGQDVTDANSTLVEFTLRPEGDGTLLRVIETGFDRLAGGEELQRSAWSDNEGGWREKTEDLARYLETSAA